MSPPLTHAFAGVEQQPALGFAGVGAVTLVALFREDRLDLLLEEFALFGRKSAAETVDSEESSAEEECG